MDTVIWMLIRGLINNWIYEVAGRTLSSVTHRDTSTPMTY